GEARAREVKVLVTALAASDRLERGIVEPNRQRTDVGAIVLSVVPDVEELHGGQVELDLEPIEASVAPTGVERIVENLLTNTGRHTPAGSHVWVRVRAEGDGVLITVQDDGPGVAE